MTRALLFGQLVLASVFAVSAVPKARGFAAFRAHVETTVLLPRGVAGLVSAVALAAEVLAAAALLHPGTARAGSALALVLLAGFTVYLARLIAQGSGAPCGCAGSSDDQAASGVHLLRNGLLLALATALLAASLAGADSAPRAVEYAVLAAPAAVTGAVLLYLPDVLTFFRTSLRPGS
ncbi:MauE/DoxX family redox-associated membrane protein [Streptomyces sp. NPDC090445]|uniref:MauE/DoxX family redox-associated membrane protein n=1 Tax=Streptomyces sp. NPDC090445 TaxID=3365963 RepID=UPI0038246BBB